MREGSNKPPQQLINSSQGAMTWITLITKDQMNKVNQAIIILTYTINAYRNLMMTMSVVFRINDTAI